MGEQDTWEDSACKSACAALYCHLFEESFSVKAEYDV